MPARGGSDANAIESTTSASEQHECKDAGAATTANVWESILDWKSWLPRLVPFMLCNIVGHYVMEGALPANFNAFNDHVVPLFGRSADNHLMDKDRFFSVFFVFVGFGDMVSR